MSPETTLNQALLDLPVREVLLTEDRGQVTRRGVLRWGGGPLSAELRGVSPLLVDGSLRVNLLGAPEVALGRAVVSRRWVPLSRPTERDADGLARDAQRAQDRLADLRAAIGRLEQRDKALGAELARYATITMRNAERGLFDLSRFEADLGRLRARVLELPRRGALLHEQLEEALRDHAAIQAMLSAIESGEVRLEAAVELSLDAPGPASVEIELRYLLPNALWRPTYEAHLRTGAEPQVDWQVQAMVWQRTGEEWEDVDVVLSTARPSQGAGLPPLHEDRLIMRPKTPEERSTVQADFRDQTVQSTSLAGGRPAGGGSTEGGPEALPGVDDGGETRVLRASAPVRLPSDGRPHRVQVSGFDAPAALRWLCVPERDTSVFREVTLDNRGTEPLLAGPVVLVLDGAYVGVGDIPYVAPGERYALSFGSNDDVVVGFERTRRIEKRKLLPDLVWFHTETTLHHTGGAPLDVEVLGRLPVSELEKVTVVRAPSTSTPEGPDEHGHVRWKIRLQPGGREELSLGFRLDLSGGVELPDPW